MAAFPSQDKRPLKKARLGPPDVYPQDPKQKEDELTSTSVKLGFSNLPHFNDEYGSGKNANISQEKFGAFFSAVMTKKIELNTWSDSSKKKPQIMKDNFWPVTTTKKPLVENWFKDLASGSKPLAHLSKRVPSFFYSKKEEIFTNLCEFNIPMIKAVWFIKMTAAHYLAMQENKPKKRQTVDQSLEWTIGLTKFMKEQLNKVQEHYHGSTTGPVMSFLTATQAPSQVDLDLALKQWHYCSRLARHMYDEGLLDRHEFLSWIVEIVEKTKQTDDTILKLVLKELLQYLDEVTLSAQLSRRLAYGAARRISQMCNDSGCTSPRTQSPMLNASNNNNNNNQLVSQNPLAAVFAEYNNCPQHRGIILSLSACLQVITMTSPSAMIWNNLSEGRSSSPYCGSPLDILPCSPSCLPMPPSEQNNQIRSQIRNMEQQIRLRSRAAEVRWSSDKCQQSTTGYTMGKVLNVLDMLDRHNFDKVESNNCLDSLYNKIFTVTQNKDGNEPLVSDEPIMTLLIDWAVSTKRQGAHRAVVVAKLLEKRQSDIRAEKYGDSDVPDDKDSAGSDMMIPASVPVFQSLLLNFLDTKAPVLDDTANSSEDSQQAFANLIHLFSELIRHEVFSHDAYMCTLISRGDLMSAPAVASMVADSVDLLSMKSEVESIKHEHQDDIKVDMDIHTMDTDFGSFFDVKDEPRLSPTAPASVKSIKSEKEQPIASVSKPEPPMMAELKGPSRHQQYATHFPLPQDELSSHECNQRLVVLFGVGKARDAARHILKKVGKEILRLYSRKSCIDMSSGDLGKPKKKKDKDEPSSVSVVGNLEVLFGKFHKLSYYDQHVVTWQCTMAVHEQINCFTSGTSTYLPQVENISYLFDLMEHSMAVNTLLEFSVQLLKDLSIVESQLSASNSNLSGIYTTSLCLCIVAIFRKYHSFLLVSEDLTFQAFEGLIGVVKHVCNPADCSSAERCILAYLYDVYTSCSYLKNKFQEMFSNAYSKIRVTLYADIKPSASNLMWDPAFMGSFLENAKTIPIEQALIDQLNKQGASRYSFVVNTMLNICKFLLSSDRLNEISVLCAELTAKCNSLSAEWLGVLKALCCSSNHNCGYIDVLTQIDVSDLSFHDNLAVFTSILIARHCFSLQDFIGYVALPSLVNPAFAGGDQDAEPGARLTCHLLLRLFKVSHASNNPYPGGNKRGTYVKASSDRHLLAAVHNNIDVGAVLAVLKAMLALADSCRDEVKTKTSSKKDSKGGDDIISTILSSLDVDISMDMMLGTSGSMENAGLSEFSKHSLREMCSQDWVREKFLRDPEGLFNSEMLLDTMLSSEQTQQLVRMICYPSSAASKMDDDEIDNKETISRILETLDPWTLRVSLLELNLMFKQAKNNAETNNILDNISQGTIYLFHQQTEHHSRTTNNSQAAALLETMPVQSPKNDSTEKDNSVWLVAPLISKLPSGVQGRVLRQAGQVLENSNTFLAPKSKLDKERKNKSLLSHQPFLSLILTCLKGQDEQREGLLNSLLNQLEKFITSFREMLEKYPDEAKIRNNIHETLQLRLSLVGGMFDTIQRNTGLTTDWALLLLQLISSGVVDLHSNYELFATVLDMLNCLMLGTLVPDPSEKSDDNRKTHSNLVKKLRKDLGDKIFEATDQVRQLLPLPKRYYEVVTVEPHGTLVDTKGNKITGFDSIKRKQGLQVGKIEMVSPWDVIESTKNPPPLSWTFFGAVKIEKKPLKYEEQHRLLLYHSHCLQKPANYYLDPPALPPEELEPPPEKVQQEEKQSREPVKTATSVDSNRPNRTRKRRGSRVTNSSSSYTPPSMPQRYNPGYSDPIYPQQAPASNWYGGPPQTQQQPAYMPQQAMQPAPGPRFGASFPSSKQAIQTMLRSRQPGTSGYMPQQSMHTNMQLLQKQRQQQMVRHRLQQQYSQNRMADNPGHYGNSVPGAAPSSAMMSMSQGPINQSTYQSNYGTMPSQPPMEPMSTGMMSQNFNQSYQSTQNPSMMSSLPQQTNYITPQSQPTQVPYSGTSRIPMQSGGMNPPSTMSGMGTYNQMGQSPTVGPAGGAGAYMQRMPTPQQQQQQQQRMQQYRQQQMLQMQQQKQQMQQSNQQQQTAAILAQLQRQVPAQQQPQMTPSFNQYPPQNF
ncbi:mediator of RNA polymerase II transcription subunit 12-like protein [Ruditapes philippinarum]|uniref:mediator of RNA polymerase II transcription subunit 12-like protein n=2 Tax=Ruditapes philippinarum TaxID=129788 RepID=UPI00295C1514|nr:mediator of RNA polymerase II transcription subunit 12-like protein [Ruditapes philippinarum]